MSNKDAVFIKNTKVGKLGAKNSAISSTLDSCISFSSSCLQMRMNLQFILGTNQSPTQSANIYVYGQNELIYYLNNMFVRYNISTKKYTIYQDDKCVSSHSPEILNREANWQCAKVDRIKESVQSNQSAVSRNKLIISKFFVAGPNSLLAVIKKMEDSYYLTLLWTESQKPVLQIKISENPHQIYTNFSFHPKKGYIYLLYKLSKYEGDKSEFNHSKQQHLRIIQVQTPTANDSASNKIQKSQKDNIFKLPLKNKSKSLFSCIIRKTGGGTCDIEDLIVSEDFTQLFLYGPDYFRQWRVLFNQKSIRQSNYRNIQRNIKKQKIAKVFWIKQHFLSNKHQEHWKPKKSNDNIQFGKTARNPQLDHISSHNLLVIVAASQLLFVKDNQLIHMTPIPDESPFRKIQRQTAEVVLQKSLNQIYKTKFRVQTSIPTEEDQSYQPLSSKSDPLRNKLIAASNPWIGVEREILNNQIKREQKQFKVFKFCGALEGNKVMVFKIFPDFSIKIESSINAMEGLGNMKGIQSKSLHLNGQIKNISSSNNGALILLTDSKKQHFINSKVQDSENNDIDPLYTAGHGHTSEIVSLSSPEINTYLTSVSKDGSFKVWNYSQKERSLIIDTKFKLRPIQSIVHPCGFMSIINFGLQIKICGIISTQLQEIVSVKTNDYCTQIEYCKVGNFLAANEKNMVKLYDPFTLQVYQKIQPDDLRLQFRKIKISENGQFLVYQCCNNRLYRKMLTNLSGLQHNFKNLHSRADQSFERNDDSHKLNRTFNCHRQSQQYTCFYFNFGPAKSFTMVATQQEKIIPLSATNIFVGFSKTKFLSLYSNYGQNLIAQFPVINGVYVTDYSVTQHMIFLATSNGSIISYRWPILESHFELQISADQSKNSNLKIGRYKLSKPVQQFVVWRDLSPITSLYKIPSKHQLVVGGIDGLIGFVDYNFFRNGTELIDNQSIISNERRRMIESMNNLRFMKIAQIDKIVKLIEKTENDIDKIDYQIQNEKQRKNKQLAREEAQLKTNMDKRKKAYMQEKNQKFVDQEKELKAHEQQLVRKKKQLETLKKLLQQDYSGKQQYQKNKIIEINGNIEKQKHNYKQRVIQLIDKHKTNIKCLKQNNLSEIRKLQKQFELTVNEKFEGAQQIQEIKHIGLNQEESNNQIHSQAVKVQQLQTDIDLKQIQLAKISLKAQNAKKQDQETQKIFEKNLQKYNQSRYQNLILHSELIKMQNQLHERRQILSKKDQIIKMAFQEKQINQTFKQFVSGTVPHLQQIKENEYKDYVKKQQDLRMLFQQLTMEINKSQYKKLKSVELKQAIKIYERQCSQKEQNIKDSIEQLKNLKKYLLVQGVSDDSEHKKIYQEQEKLLATIRWLQKRFRMNCINEKKLANLKRSGVGQIINQNKNLLEECNQLRQQGIIFENQINHLSQKLAEANKIIQIQKKVKSHKNAISKQSQQLNEIRKLFKDQIEKANQEIQQSEQL